VRNIGDKLTALAIAVGQPIPLAGYLPGQLDKAFSRTATSFPARIRRSRRQQLDGADAVLLQPGTSRSAFTGRVTQYQVSRLPAGQTAPPAAATTAMRSTALFARRIRQRVKVLALQNNIQIAPQLAVEANRRHAKDFLFVDTARIVAVHRPGSAGEKALHRRNIDTLARICPGGAASASSRRPERSDTARRWG
jgi:hypothetical protein